MAFTLFGIAVAGTALLMLLLQRPPRDFFIVLLLSSVLGASEAVRLTALGGSSLVVPSLMVPLFAARLILTGGPMRAVAWSGIIENRWLVCYALLGLIGAITLPRLFAGIMEVVPLRPTPYRVPIVPTSQNITQAVYLILTTAAAICAYVTARTTGSDRALVRGVKWAATLYLLFAFVDVTTFYAGVSGALDWVRTANYAILDQSELGVRRISGSFTEPSAFASYGFPLLCFFSARWLYGGPSRGSAQFALALAAALLLSTSSTAYASLLLLAPAMLFGALFLPGVRGGRLRKLFNLLGLLVIVGVGALTLMQFFPTAMDTALTILERMTVAKGQSESAIERGKWAQQGYDVFVATWGLGVGAGSFRSSGLLPATLGSLGFLGALLLLLHCLRMVRVVTQLMPMIDPTRVAPMALAALGALVGPMLSGSAPDPGLLFALFSGYCIGCVSPRNFRWVAAPAQQGSVIPPNDGALAPAYRAPLNQRERWDAQPIDHSPREQNP